MRTEVLELDVQVLSLMASFVIPGLVALLAKANAARWFKALLNGVLSVAAAAVAIAIAADGKIETSQWIMQALIAYGTSELSYRRVWEPSGASAAIQVKVPGGVGPEGDRL